MFCPKCGAEYRQGYTSCADCHVFLAAERPPRSGAGLAWASRADEEPDSDQRQAESEQVYRDEEPPEPGDPSEDPFCSFWKGNDARVCAELCTVLDEAGIPHKTVHRSDHLFNLNNQAGYELGVPASMYEKAELAIKEAFGTAEDTVRLLLPGEEDPRAKNLRKVWTGENGTECAAMCSGPVRDEQAYPEDATRLAWSGEPAEWQEMIEMSLKENDVGMRWEMRDGKPNLFVLPEDEARAKEIVREVIEGTPMK